MTTPLKVIIAGSRTFMDYEQLASRCDHFLSREVNKRPIEIVSGTARGADRLGEKYARERGYTITQFPADWNRYGRSAGYKRNVQMADYADALIAFPLGEARGTNHMIRIAQDKGLTVRIGNKNTTPHSSSPSSRD